MLETEAVAELIAPIVPVEPPVAPEPEPIVEDLELEDLTPPTPSAHPLAPGGKRFEQVYAQSKQAQRDLAEERERRIAAEAKLTLLEPKAAPSEKEYNWDELEAMIAQGQITRGQAYAHRESVANKKTRDDLRQEFKKDTEDATRVNALSQGIYSYVAAVPDINNRESAVRIRVDREFDWLVDVQGRDQSKLSSADRKALELTALRNVLGPVETLAKRVATPNVETHQGSIGGSRPDIKVNPDQKLLDALTPREIAHYQRMFTLGKYPAKWKDVVAELKFVPPTRS